jgi:hypothetical protein
MTGNGPLVDRVAAALPVVGVPELVVSYLWPGVYDKLGLAAGEIHRRLADALELVWTVDPSRPHVGVRDLVSHGTYDQLTMLLQTPLHVVRVTGRLDRTGGHLDAWQATMRDRYLAAFTGWSVNNLWDRSGCVPVEHSPDSVYPNPTSIVWYALDAHGIPVLDVYGACMSLRYEHVEAVYSTFPTLLESVPLAEFRAANTVARRVKQRKRK